MAHELSASEDLGMPEDGGGTAQPRLTGAPPSGRRATQRAGWLVVPIVLFLMVAFVIPLTTVLLRSLTDPSVGFGNFTALWESTAFRRILLNTGSIALWTTVACGILAYPMAFWITSLPGRWPKRALAIVMTPVFTAILARLYSWSLILSDRGLINTYLSEWGLIEEPFAILFTGRAVIIGTVHVMLPLMVAVLYSSMISIDRRLIEAANSLGASNGQTFRRVYFPLTLPAVVAGSLLVFVISVGFFITPAVLGGPGDLTIATFIDQQIRILRWGSAAAMAVVLVVVTVVLFVVINRSFNVDRVITGGTRG